MPNAVDDLPITNVEGIFFLLIPSRFPPVPLYRRIAAGRDGEVSDLAEVFNPRVKEKQRLSGSLGAAIDETSPRLQNWNLAPFAYQNPEGSYFFDQFTRCLELSDDKQTALAVSVAKREIFLNRTKEAPTGLDMRMLSRPVSGNFLDARNLPTDVSLEDRRALGRTMLERRQTCSFDGVLFRSPERPSGNRMAVLTGEVLERAIQGEHFRYTWDGKRIASIYEFNNTRSDEDNKINPNDLRGEKTVLAA